MRNHREINVLVVDDEQRLCRNLVAFFEDEGFDVQGVYSAEDGLKMLDIEPFDVAVVDIRLPGKDGNTFIEEAHASSLDLLFFVHTGSAQYVLPDEVCKAGVSNKDIFLKPVSDMGVLADAIREKVNARNNKQS